ncbi:hypothetical protein IV60_GL000104 [Lancefieldella rimae]|uniref:TIGR00153 family protein n=2 Tax=Lancefieldella rimae TaxID=1383 RepID=B9CL31_LANR4|nr:DUF47 family protein [Lancefieldella rimae]EEE17724.1 hypothetical protein ATORI0001_0745 [Lancefieldella rimae ATCC 49626]KRO02934.1 hypothetical protein IV60_GL000104 [Lancefieldella rimae]
MFGEPKEDIFYTLFKEFGAKIVETAEEYSTILDGYPETAARIPQMKVYERECDEKVQRIMKELYSSFVTPFEREDISDLALGLDDIVDGMNSVSERLDLFNVDEFRKEGAQLAELTLRACITVKEMLDHLADYKKDPIVMEKAIAVGHVEDEGDLVYHNALSRLFRDEMTGRETVAWLRIFDRMEQALDSCDKAAGIVRSVVMKNA